MKELMIEVISLPNKIYDKDFSQQGSLSLNEDRVFTKAAVSIYKNNEEYKWRSHFYLINKQGKISRITMLYSFKAKRYYILNYR